MPQNAAMHEGRHLYDHLGRVIRASSTSSGGFEGSGTGRRLATWNETDSAISALLAAEGDMLVRRCRGLARKNGWAKNAESSYCANAIGSGIVPRSLHPDESMRKRINEAWKRSSEELDADGRHDFSGMQMLAMNEIFEGGEVFARGRARFDTDGLYVPIQVQIIPTEQLSRTMNTIAETGNPVRLGIEMNKTGRQERVAYHFYRENPRISSLALASNPSEITRVSAQAVAHCYRSYNAGQLRGIPWLSAAMVTLWELQQLTDAVLVKMKLSNMFIGSLESLDSSGDNALGATSTTAGDETADEGTFFGQLEPGQVLNLIGTGGGLKWSEPPDSPADFPAYLNKMLHLVAAACDIPFTLIDWNTSDVNFSSMRGELNELRRRIEQFQFSIFVFQFCRPIWRWWINAAVLAGRLPQPRNAEEWNALYSVDWRTPAWAWVNPKEDADTAIAIVRASLDSWQGQVRERSLDPEQLAQEIAEGNAIFDRLGIVSDSDPRQTQKNGAARAAAPAVDPAAQPAAQARGPVARFREMASAAWRRIPGGSHE